LRTLKRVEEETSLSGRQRASINKKAAMSEDHAPPHAPVALIIIDVISRFDFPDGDLLLPHALSMAPRLARLKARARSAGIPAIYVNDNFGQWRSDASRLIVDCLHPGVPGKKFVEILCPDDKDYFVLKPMHSAFYQTPLEILLKYLGVHSLILSGLATNSCVVCTAHDANMRGFQLFVPSACSAARTSKEHRQAIQHIKAMTKANVAPSASLRWEQLLKTVPNS
jgi:nicotinamidase-related amidase